MQSTNKQLSEHICLRAFRFVVMFLAMHSVTGSNLKALEPPPKEVSIALAGDSTVTDNQGWGGKFISFLPKDVTVYNRAIGGRSTKSFIDEGSWLSAVNLACDYVFIQFGHNDQKLNDTRRGTYPIAIRPAGVDARPLDLFSENLSRMVDDVRAKGGRPVLITSLARRGRVADANGILRFQNDVPDLSPCDAWGNCYSLFNYVEATIAVAEQKGVPVIDLNRMSLDLYNRMIENGDDITALGPNGDNTHLNDHGASVIARLIADAIPEALPQSHLWR